MQALGRRRPVRADDRSFVAANATVVGSVDIGPRVSIWFGAVLRGDNDWIRLGRDSNVQDGAILHTDPGIELIVGERVTIGHRAMLHGCTVGNDSLIGIGSTVLNGATIGASCLVGAHALVTEGKTFPDGVLIVGAPARVVRDLTDEEREALRRSADVYVANGRRYLEELAQA